MTLSSDEQWRPIPAWEGYYEASDQGRVRSVDRVVVCSDGRRKLLRGRPRTAGRHFRHGYLTECTVTLYRDNTVESRSVHSLVLGAFVGPRPDGLEIRHVNGDPADNRLVNLAYGTKSENERDKLRHGTHNNARKTHCPQGHPYDEANTYVLASRPNARYCMACQRARRLAYYHRHKH